MTAGQEMIHQNDSQAYNTEKNINNTFWCQKWLKPKFDMRLLSIAAFLVLLSNFDLYIKANQSRLTKATARKMKEEGSKCISELSSCQIQQLFSKAKKLNQFLVSAKINTFVVLLVTRLQWVLYQFSIKYTLHAVLARVWHVSKWPSLCYSLFGIITARRSFRRTV